jgi:hypothetical protein
VVIPQQRFRITYWLQFQGSVNPKERTEYRGSSLTQSSVLGLHPFSNFLKDAKCSGSQLYVRAVFLFSGKEAPNVVDSLD